MSQEQEPKTLREILLWYMGEIERGTDKVLCDWDPQFEDSLLAWAKAYGEQVREVPIQYLLRWKMPPGVWLSAELGAAQMAIEIRQLKLPEPK